MTARGGLFWSAMILLLVVTWSLAIAEEHLGYALIVSFSCLVAGMRVVIGRQPLWSARINTILTVGCFVFIGIDY